MLTDLFNHVFVLFTITMFVATIPFPVTDLSLSSLPFFFFLSHFCFASFVVVVFFKIRMPAL